LKHKPIGLLILSLSMGALADNTQSGSPSGTQPIDQPTGSTSSFRSINSVLNALEFTGSDIGAKVNAALATFSGTTGGAVFIPANPSGCYPYSTPIVMPMGVRLFGAGRYNTCIQYTRPTGIAVKVSGAQASIDDLTIAGPAISGQSNTGLLVAASNFSSNNMQLGGFTSATNAPAGFATGLTFGDNAFTNTFRDLFVWQNFQNMVFPTGLSDAGEEVARFMGGTFANGTSTGAVNCIINGKAGVIGGGEFSFFGTSFDGCQVVNYEGTIKFFGVHFEDVGSLSGIPFVVTLSTNLEGTHSTTGTFIEGADVIYDHPQTGHGVFEVDRSGSLTVTSLNIATPSIPIFYLDAGIGGDPSLTFIDPASLILSTNLFTLTAATVNPHITIHTAATSISTSNNSNAAFIGLASGVPYIHAPITIVKNNGVNFYAWTGTTNSYSGTRVQSSGSNTQICTTSNFPYTGDPTSLGGETWACQGIMNSTATAPRGTCSTPNGYIVATINGSLVHIATCP
jgi:hypothetical protein